ncbi:MAG: alpha/beta hydrolase [Betaproteobacteria bacterium]|nr:alpha/beta hydrolase [Betaproteobacteria bacterium]
MPYATAAGHSLEYQRIDGDPVKPVLVFLHEGLGSIGQWRDFPVRLTAATGCPGLVYARYGFGQSDVLAGPRPFDFMHQEARVALPELLAVLGIARPILVGHSDGASIALIHAGTPPWSDSLRGVAVMAPHVLFEDMNTDAIRAARQAFETTDLPQRLGKYHRDAARTFYGWADVWCSPAFRQWNIEDILTGIRCPVLAIQGHQDAYGTMAHLDSIAARVRGPCELLKLEDCAHTPFREQPAKTLEAVARFVNRLCAAGQGAGSQR